MYEIRMCCVKAILVIMFLIFDGTIADEDFVSGSKQKRGGNMGLFPFPRVGRAGNEIPWANGYPDLSKMHELKTRQGLMPFPRVGRSDLRPQTIPGWILSPENTIEFQKRNGNGANGGLWFGPRLGRLQKRSFDYNDAPWTFIALKDPFSMRQADFTPRLGRESEEDQENEDSVVEEILTSRRLDAKNRNNLTQQ